MSMSVSCVLNLFYLNKASLSDTVEEIGARRGITFAFSDMPRLISDYNLWSTYLRNRPTFLYGMVCILGYRSSSLNDSATPIAGTLLTTGGVSIICPVSLVTNYLFTSALSESVPSLFSRRSRALSSAAFLFPGSSLPKQLAHAGCNSYFKSCMQGSSGKIVSYIQTIFVKPVSCLELSGKKIGGSSTAAHRRDTSVFMIANFSLFAKEVNTNDFHVCICDRLFLSWIKLDVW